VTFAPYGGREGPNERLLRTYSQDGPNIPVSHRDVICGLVRPGGAHPISRRVIARLGEVDSGGSRRQSAPESPGCQVPHFFGAGLTGTNQPVTGRTSFHPRSSSSACLDV
jgi:hypothetical protein